MDLTLTDDQRLIQATAREFLESRHPSADVRAMRDDPVGYSTGLWKEMVELGWMGLGFPEEYGGVGAGFLELCLLAEQLGRFAVPSPFVPTVVCCGLPIARFGTERQKAEWLGAIGRGCVMSYAHTGWDAPGAGLVATATPDGFTLDGTALFVPFAQAADELLVVARRRPESGTQDGTGTGAPDGTEQPVVLLVDTAGPGITRTPLEVIGADRAHQVDFAGVAVPAARLLGAGQAGGADGNAVVEALTAHGIAATCAEMVGGAQRVLDMTVEYATSREQFGRPIGSFQAVQHHCADMAIDVLGSRFIAYEAIWRLSAGVPAALEVSMAKAWVSEAYQRDCAAGHQVHGAIGFTREHDMHFYFRHAMASALTFGDSDVHWERVARHLGITT